MIFHLILNTCRIVVKNTSLLRNRLPPVVVVILTLQSTPACSGAPVALEPSIGCGDANNNTKPPRNDHSGFINNKSPTNDHSSFISNKSPINDHSGFMNHKSPVKDHSGFINNKSPLNDHSSFSHTARQSNPVNTDSQSQFPTGNVTKPIASPDMNDNSRISRNFMSNFNQQNNSFSVTNKHNVDHCENKNSENSTEMNSNVNNHSSNWNRTSQNCSTTLNNFKGGEKYINNLCAPVSSLHNIASVDNSGTQNPASEINSNYHMHPGTEHNLKTNAFSQSFSNMKLKSTSSSHDGPKNFQAHTLFKSPVETCRNHNSVHNYDAQSCSVPHQNTPGFSIAQAVNSHTAMNPFQGVFAFFFKC